MKQKRFHRHFETPGLPLYWIIIAYIIIGWFFPVIGLIAIICMVGPVMTSIWKGRWWCGHVCPRGNMYDRLLSKYSPHRPIPKFVRTFGFRLFMVFFIFTMFGIQLTFTVPWSEGGLPMWMRLTPYDSRGQEIGFLDPDCLKCGKCTQACPTKIITLKHTCN